MYNSILKHSALHALKSKVCLTELNGALVEWTKMITDREPIAFIIDRETCHIHQAYPRPPKSFDSSITSVCLSIGINNKIMPIILKIMPIASGYSRIFRYI